MKLLIEKGGIFEMKQIVKPIKDSWVLSAVQQSLKEDFKTGQRNYTIFQVGKATLLRVSDVLRLKKSDVYDERGRVKRNAYIIDKKTRKPNTLYLKPVERDLEDYFDWLKKYQQENQLILCFLANGSSLHLLIPINILMKNVIT